MNLSRKERIEAAKHHEKQSPKRSVLKKGVKLASFTAAASTVIVPAYATPASADEIASNNQDQGDKVLAKPAGNQAKNVEASSVAKPLSSYSAAATYSNVEKNNHAFKRNCSRFY
ncbi:hypothetical protein MFLO_13630 [Listeria floridensis FSL S10-1187]|uniref:Uncharacterized protein n=1 Tax=Listeria floridensis FSL S10-1187 TaxID=1265817 RepID=A0ABN0RCH4_9LIST|nr:hypothetical protein MFLO_13630 [Listeria floridensis FSL S10-1187]